ncbi:hypothetical protein SAMN04488100_1489 [Alkalibacterium putridalgicola]|nr:hypothetical protein SAMN04488100_1489 [Alkalibacterium putridalgicola]
MIALVAMMPILTIQLFSLVYTYQKNQKHTVVKAGVYPVYPAYPVLFENLDNRYF